MKVKLKVLVGKSAGKEIAIPAPRFLIGRSSDCHLRPKSDSISRNHCTILTRKDRVMVRDLNSRNGTFVNGERITDDAQIRDGDQLQVGKLEFVVIVKETSVKESSHGESSHGESSHEESSHEESSHEESGHEESGHEESGHEESGHEESGHGESGHGESGHGESGHGESGHGESGHGESGHGETAAKEAEAKKPDDQKEQSALEEKPTAKPASVKDPESLEFDVTEWLQEADGDSPEKSEPETRLFQLDDTDQMAVAADEAEHEEEPNATAGRKEKKKPGKLPPRSGAQSNSSREAAADMLKRFFTSR